MHHALNPLQKHSIFGISGLLLSLAALRLELRIALQRQLLGNLGGNLSGMR
nr:hypothetical protein [uncultured Ralstonia sp.]